MSERALELNHFEAMFLFNNAKLAGWVDPGLTEPLDVTLERAWQYMDEHKLIVVSGFAKREGG